jgi:hypothetical protein
VSRLRFLRNRPNVLLVLRRPPRQLWTYIDLLATVERCCAALRVPRRPNRDWRTGCKSEPI